jgi:hypothetical protein
VFGILSRINVNVSPTIFHRSCFPWIINPLVVTTLDETSLIIRPLVVTSLDETSLGWYVPGVIPPTVMHSNMELFASKILKCRLTSYFLFLSWKASLLYILYHCRNNVAIIYLFLWSIICGGSLFKRFMQCIKTCFSRFSLPFFHLVTIITRNPDTPFSSRYQLLMSCTVLYYDHLQKNKFLHF